MVAIITRHEWGARPARTRRVIDTPTPRLWLHHFATDSWHGPAGMRACQKFHMDTNGWSDIAYSFCVDLDGRIYEARGAGIAGGHTRNDNSKSHAICLMINSEVTHLSRPMVQATAKLAAYGNERGWWGDWTGGHHQAPGASTACPGKYAKAAFPDIRGLTVQYLQPAPEPVEDDMGDYLEQIEAIYEQQWGRRMRPSERIDVVKMLRTKPEGPQFVVNEFARQLKHPPIYS